MDKKKELEIITKESRHLEAIDRVLRSPLEPLDMLKEISRVVEERRRVEGRIAPEPIGRSQTR